MQKISRKEILKDIKDYKLQKNHFTPETYTLGGIAVERAEKNLDLYMKGELEISPNDYKIFAKYINVFASFDEDAMLNKLQSSCSFDVRKYLETAKIIAVGAEDDGEYKHYLSAKKLQKKMKKYISFMHKIEEKGSLRAYDLVMKTDSMRTDAEEYLKDFLDEKFKLYDDDVEVFKQYIRVVLGQIYDGDVADQALKKLESGNFSTRTRSLKIGLGTKLLAAISPKKISVKNTFGKIGKFYSNLKSKISGFGKRVLKVVSATAAIVALSLIGDGGAQQTKTNSTLEPEQNKEIKNSVAKKKENKNTSSRIFVETLQKQDQVKAKVMNKTKADSFKNIMENYYETALKIHADGIGKETYQTLTEKFAKQVQNKNLRLPSGVSTNQFMYTVVIHKVYGIPSAAEAALNSKTPVSAEMMKQISQEIERAADRGTGVKKLAEQIAKEQGKSLSKHSNFAKVSAKMQKQHLKNLKQWKDAKIKANNAK